MNLITNLHRKNTNLIFPRSRSDDLIVYFIVELHSRYVIKHVQQMCL